MERCRHVHIAPLIKRTASSLKLRRSALLPRGKHPFPSITACHRCAIWACALKMLIIMLRSAKYIEGLENRLGRMEHILRLSGSSRQFPLLHYFLSYSSMLTCVLRAGILGDDDDDDLGEIEKRLSEKHRDSAGTASAPSSPSQAHSGRGTPQSALTSPEPGAKEKDEKRRSIDPAAAEEEKKDEEEVSALSEMMCSLVTNQSGETRYIGQSLSQILLA